MELPTPRHAVQRAVVRVLLLGSAFLVFCALVFVYAGRLRDAHADVPGELSDSVDEAGPSL